MELHGEGTLYVAASPSSVDDVLTLAVAYLEEGATFASLAAHPSVKRARPRTG